MAPHSGFKLAIIRTMRCDTCNTGNVNGLQECVSCNMHFCRECIESGKLDNDEKHRMNQNAIANLDWNKSAAKDRRAANRRGAAVNIPTSHDAPSKEQRRESRRAERHLRHEARHSGTHNEPAPRFQGPHDHRVQPHMGAFPGSGFNMPVGNRDHVGHGNFPYASAPPGYPPGYFPSPPGYAPSLPAHSMPYGDPSSGPGQYGQPPHQGGLAMPFRLMYGNPLPVNPGMPPRGNPRLHTPPGPQFAPSGYPVPNNFGGYYAGGPMEYTPAPTPPNFPGPGFHQPPSQPQPMYNDRGYVLRGNIPTGQPVSGPGHAPGHAFGQPYGRGALPHAPPPQEQPQPRGREGEPAQGGTTPRFGQPALESRAREPTSQGHAEQPVDPLTIQRQQQQQAWEREQARQAWEQEQSREAWARQQAQQVFQRMWEQSQRQPVQQNAQPVAQQQQSQSQSLDEHQTQPAVQQAIQTLQQAQQQDEQRKGQGGEQQSQQQVLPPISEGGAPSAPSPITAPPFTLPPIVAPHFTASPVTLPPITAPPITAPPITAPPITAPPITAPPITAPPITAPPITAPPIAAPNVQEAQTPVSIPAPPPPSPEADTTSQLSQLHLRQTVIAPTVVEHAQRPFGIPALARDMYAGRPNHYDETAARWAQAQAQAQPVRPKQIREYDEDDYDDYNIDNETDDDATETDPARPGSPSAAQPPPPRGQKRTRSRAASSSVDSTLSAEMDPGQPPAGAGRLREGRLLDELYQNEDIRRARRVGGERAALDMAAAANTLWGNGRGLIGSLTGMCVANDAMIMRRKEELKRKIPGGKDWRDVEPAEKKQRRGDGGGGGSGDGVPDGEVGRG